MADQYGVVPTGFARKTLGVNLAEIETAMVDVFGADVVQDAQSPLGQLNGLFADLITDIWELGEDVYQSFDIDQAGGPRLDMLGKLRRAVRPDGEADADYQYRLTNQGQTDISLTENLNRIRAIEGVTWASVRVNSTDVPDSLGLPAHAVAYAVVGGDDDAVGLAIYQQTVPGITLYGNTTIEVVADGFCQKVKFIRPDDVKIRVELDVQHIADNDDCAPPSISAVVNTVLAAFIGQAGYRNGDTVSADRLAMEAARAGDLKIVDVRIARYPALAVDETIETTLFERAVIVSPFVAARYV
jgi:hypothetical protein